MSEHLNSNVLTQALEYASLGLHVLALHGIRDGVCTCGEVNCKSPGKHPVTQNGLKDATTDTEIITAWMTQDTPRNIAIRTGEESGIFVVDIDGPKGEEAIASYFGSLPSTMETTTGRGRHLYYRYPDHAVKSFADIFGGDSKVDCRGENGYVVAAGSTHISGKKYQAVTRPIVVAPKALLNVVCKANKQPLRESRRFLSASKQEMTNDEIREILSFLDADIGYDEWLKVGMALHSGGYPVELWDDWSKQGKKYKPGDCYYKWSTFSLGEQS